MPTRMRSFFLSSLWLTLLTFTLSITTVNCGGEVVNENNAETTGDGGISKDGVTTDGQTEPQAEPTVEPQAEPTAEPQAEPQAEPTVEPQAEPTVEPTAEPTVEPTTDAGEAIPETPAEINPDLPEAIIPEIAQGTGAFHVNQLFIVMDPNDGFDLNGDMTVDNRFGELLGSIALLLAAFGADVQQQITDQITSQRLILLLELANNTDPTVQTGTVDVNFYIGQKSSVPGTFGVDPSSIDANGNAVISFKNVTVNNGVVTAGPGDFRLNLALFPGQPALPVTLKMTRITFQVDPQLRVLTAGKLGGALPMWSLDLIDGINNQTVLQLLVGLNPRLAQPDIDLDADGLEKFNLQGSTLECVDGDGTTKFTAPTACHPGVPNCTAKSCAVDTRMTDGISTVFRFNASAITIVKPTPAP
ncbi:MAG: procyclic acidic repetitive family protein [Myxococcales bacterium]|nr:procyclic acidic repetitive family protein [Myxococcales bacterium]